MAKKKVEENKDCELAKTILLSIAMGIILLVVVFIGIYYGLGIFEKMPR